MYKINGFQLSVDINSATKNDKNIDLTHQEQDALKLFFASDDGFVDSQTLESKVWEERVVTKNSLRKLISDLRLKFNDKESFKNIRGKGYQLTFESIENSINISENKKHSKLLLSTIIIAPLLVIAAFFYSYTSGNLNAPLPTVSTQTVFESNDYILDYATYGKALFVTARDNKTSKLYKVLNRQNTILMSANHSGAYRGIEIHSSGRTVMHVVEDSKCKIKIFNRPVEDQIDEIPCSRQNAFPSFDWIDDSKFYITFNVDPNASIKPFIYDLVTKRLEEVTTTNFESENGDKFIDAFIKAHGNGMFSLREDHLDQMSLMFFMGDKRKTFYQFRSKPYSIAVSEDNLFFVGNNNELFKMDLAADVYSQETNISLLLAPQTTKIDDPLVLQDELYFSLGNIAKEVIYSTSGNFKYSLENGIRDFTYTDKVLSVLAVTNSGYVVEQLKKGVVFNTVYLDTKLSFRHLAFYQDELYLAGSDGIYKVTDKKLTQVSQVKTAELVSNGQCMIAEGNGIYKFKASSNTFEKLVEQGERAFQSQHGCLFVDNLSGNIVNEKRVIISKQTKNRLLIEHQGKIAHRYNVNEETHIVDLETGDLITKTKSRAFQTRLISYDDDILYLGQDDVNTSIMKLKLN
jgi:DNA-binding winged helix-turn-helix (wHTH) protein